MSVHVDRSFLLRLSPKLKKFTRKKDDLYNFRCPLCGDSETNKSKSRGYVYRRANDYFYMCHNCGVSTTFYNFLKQVDSSLIPEYTLERFKNQQVALPDPTPVVVKTTPKPINLPTIESLPEFHMAKRYVTMRNIPDKFYEDLYYAEDFAAFVKSMGVVKTGLVEGEPRLIIPLRDMEGNLTAFQGRSLDGSKIRYITIRLVEDAPRFFGLDRVDLTKPVYVFEGPIDSMFIENGVAVASSSLESIIEVIDKEHVVLVYDNEPRNKEILTQIEEAIDNHFSVVIWPDMIEEKDVNDMILETYSIEEMQDILETNTFVNLRAKMKFINWKKN